jgi:dCMP deaminase
MQNSPSGHVTAVVCAAAVLGGAAVLAAQRMWPSSSSSSSSSSASHPIAVPAASAVLRARTGANTGAAGAPSLGTPAAAGHFQRMIKIEQERDRALSAVRHMQPKIVKLQTEVAQLRRRRKGPVVSLPDPSATGGAGGGREGGGSIGSIGSIATALASGFSDPGSHALAVLTRALRPNANKRTDPTDPSPRDLYLSWDDYFMSLAFLSALRSKDPNKQVGAVITGPDRVILGIGYNGFPRGCSDELLPWAKKSDDGSPLGTKYPYVCHAEMNAIMNKNAASLKGASIYVTMFPCNNCAKLLIQAGIREVVYYEDKRGGSAGSRSGPRASTPTKGGLRPDPAYTASQRLLGHAEVELRQHKPERPIFLDF